MIINILSAVVLATVGMVLFFKSTLTVTRRMSFVALSMAAMELAMLGALPLLRFPTISLILFACRFTLLVCCSRALKQEAGLQRNRRRRRAVWRRIAATAPEACVLGVQHPHPAVRRCA